MTWLAAGERYCQRLTPWRSISCTCLDKLARCGASEAEQIAVDEVPRRHARGTGYAGQAQARGPVSFRYDHAFQCQVAPAWDPSFHPPMMAPAFDIATA